jgi:hypothetical protein
MSTADFPAWNQNHHKNNTGNISIDNSKKGHYYNISVIEGLCDDDDNDDDYDYAYVSTVDAVNQSILKYNYSYKTK